MEHKLQKNECSKTLEIQGLIRREIISLGALYDRDLNPKIYDLWFRSLQDDPRTRDMSLEAMRSVFAKIASTFKPTSACPFPTPAHFIECLQAPERSAYFLVAEEAWNAAMKWVRDWYLGPDMGFDRRAPEMEEKQHRGIIAAGGFEHVSSCSLDDLQWAKKRFIENFAHQSTVEENGYLIGRGEAVKILDRLRSPDAGMKLLRKGA